MWHEVAEQLEALQWFINQHLRSQATINWIIVRGSSETWLITEKQFPVITVTLGFATSLPL